MYFFPSVVAMNNSRVFLKIGLVHESKTEHEKELQLRSSFEIMYVLQGIMCVSNFQVEIRNNGVRKWVVN